MEDLLEDLGKEAVSPLHPPLPLSSPQVWPNRITLPLSSSADPQLVIRCGIPASLPQVWQPQPGGLLGVRLSKVEGLPSKGEEGWGSIAVC